MKILAIANVIPMRDRSAGWFRFFHLLRMLADQHEIHLHPFDLEWQYSQYGKEAISGYQSELENLGVRITTGKWVELSGLIRALPADMVFFEHYSTARGILDHVRFWQPQARVIVDTIDIAFQRLSSKATLTRKTHDLELANLVKAEELTVYSGADIVIGISDAEKAILEQEDPTLQVEVIPLVYAVPPLQETTCAPRNNLVFVAHFDHDANVDGIVYFCDHVLPLIQNQVPDIRLRIVGHSPPKAVRDLAGPNVAVLGYVPDIRALYESSAVAIALMRFGGGLKGKIAEAMSYGLPVVTNSVCLEGFSLSPGENVLIGDDPEQFARAVVEVLQDVNLYQTMRKGGWDYVRTHFSEEVIARKLNDVISRSQQYPAKKTTGGHQLHPHA
jgi:glycosyltransferase involved in cell wall biosynthesis